MFLFACGRLLVAPDGFLETAGTYFSCHPFPLRFSPRQVSPRKSECLLSVSPLTFPSLSLGVSNLPKRLEVKLGHIFADICLQHNESFHRLLLSRLYIWIAPAPLLR